MIQSACLVVCSLLALLQGEEGGEVQPVLHQILERAHLLYTKKEISIYGTDPDPTLVCQFIFTDHICFM